MNNELVKMAKDCTVKVRSMVSSWLEWFPPTFTRVCLGVLFVETGWGKIHGLTHVIAYFTQLGIPHPVFNAYLVAYTELVGGTLILLGLFTRVAVIPLLISMTVAILTAKRNDISGFGDLVMTVEFTFIILFTWLAIYGAGPLSLDNFIWRTIAADPKSEAISIQRGA